MSFLVSEITIIFASDGDEWDRYLTDCFAQLIEYPLTISHKHIEDIFYPISKCTARRLSKSDAIVLILSPDFLNLIDILKETVFQLSSLFKPNKTLLMFCGITQNDLKETHKSVLINYNRCHRLFGRNYDKQFIINVINCLLNVLKLNTHNSIDICINERKMINNSPQFEFSLENIFETQERVYILLESPISENEKIHLSIGVSDEALMVYWKNPYTLYFTIPEFMIFYEECLNISLICGHKYLGTRKIRCHKRKVDENNNCNYSDIIFESNNNDYQKKTNKNLIKNINQNINVTKILINDEDYYFKSDCILPIHECRGKKDFRPNMNTIRNSWNEIDFHKKYSIYDIPRSASLSKIDEIEREIFV